MRIKESRTVEYTPFLVAARKKCNQLAACVWIITSCIHHSDGSTIEAKAKNDILWLHIITPQQIQSSLHLSQISVALEIGACPLIILVPSSMEVVGHQIEIRLAHMTTSLAPCF
jgi:hypothetical protein